MGDLKATSKVKQRKLQQTQNNKSTSNPGRGVTAIQLNIM